MCYEYKWVYEYDDFWEYLDYVDYRLNLKRCSCKLKGSMYVKVKLKVKWFLGLCIIRECF